MDVLRSTYEFHPIRIREALHQLRKKTRLDKPLAQRELYAIPEFQNLIDARQYKGKREYVDLAHNQNLVFETFVTSLGKRIERDGRGRALRIFPWKDAESEESPVSIDPDVVAGELVVTGTRIPAQVIWGRYISGRSVESIAQLYGLSTDLVEKVLFHFERQKTQKIPA